jgi:hypothetical protein
LKDDEPDKELKEILEPKVIESAASHKAEVGKKKKQMKEKKGNKLN